MMPGKEGGWSVAPPKGSLLFPGPYSPDPPQGHRGGWGSGSREGNGFFISSYAALRNDATICAVIFK